MPALIGVQDKSAGLAVSLHQPQGFPPCVPTRCVLFSSHLLSGLDIIGPHSIYASEELRRQTSASEAEHDEYRGGAMAFDDSFARNHADSA